MEGGAGNPGAGGRAPSPWSRSLCRMDFRTPDLLDAWLESPEDVFSTGTFPEPGLHGPPPEAPGTKLQEQGLRGWEPSGGRGCVSGRDAGGVGGGAAVMRGPSGFSLHLETSEGQAPKGHVICNHPHVQGHKGLKRPDAGLTSHSTLEFSVHIDSLWYCRAFETVSLKTS